jgi:Na+/proline symporter
MSFSELGVVALAVYLTFMLAVAEVARLAKRDSTPSDHFLGGRQFGLFVLFMTLYATAYSGNSLLGYPGKAYRSGFSFVMSVGFMLAVIVCFHIIVPRLRPLAAQRGYVTPGDFIRDRFGGERSSDWLRIAVGLLMVAALGNFLLAQLKAMGEVTQLVTGGLIPYEMGVVGLALLILFYETRGGMRAVAWTDAAQGVLMMVGLAALATWLVSAAGGLEAVTRAVAEVRPDAVAVPDRAGIANWFSTIALLGLASAVYPQAIQRIYAARDGRTLARSFALMSFMPLITTWVVTLIGIAAIARLDMSVDSASDGVLPVLLHNWASQGGLNEIGAILVFIGVLSAIMSTADSCLLSLGSLMARDVLGRSGHRASDTLLGKRWAGGILLAMVPIALFRDVTLWRLIELKLELLIQCVPAFMLALHWRRQTTPATLLGLVVGTGFAVVLTLSGTSRIGGVHVGIVALVLNGAIVMSGSALRGARPKANSGVG